MALDILVALQTIQTTIRALPRMRKAPDYPPEQMSEFPFAVLFLSSGVVDNWAFGKKRQMHTLTLQIHVARKDLPTNIADMMPYAESVPEALMALDEVGLSGYSMGFPLTYRFGPLGWGSPEPSNTLGFSWTISLEGEESL